MGSFKMKNKKEEGHLKWNIRRKKNSNTRKLK